MELLKFMMENYRLAMEGQYQIEGGSPYKVLEQTTRVRSYLAKGGKLDMNKTVNLSVSDFRSRKLGRVTLEFPPTEEA